MLNEQEFNELIEESQKVTEEIQLKCRNKERNDQEIKNLLTKIKLRIFEEAKKEELIILCNKIENLI
ncbi:MAG: hypothetical protein ACP5OG_01695 [Candidatus Nanoarchaeia archaeon]